MKLTQVPNLRLEDFPSEQNWLGKLFVQLNPMIQSLNQIFNNNIDYATNIKSVSKIYSITSFSSFSFSWPYTDATPVDVRVVKATRSNSPTILLAAWSYDSGTRLITISQMAEINGGAVGTLSGTYNFTIRATV